MRGATLARRSPANIGSAEYTCLLTFAESGRMMRAYVMNATLALRVYPAELVSKTWVNAHLSVVWEGGQGLRERCHAGFELVFRNAGVNDEDIRRRHDVVRGHFVLNGSKLVIQLRHLLLHGWRATSVQECAHAAHGLP